MKPMTEPELENYKLHRRFDRMGRLVGDTQMSFLMNQHVMIIGLGGVGSWAAESIARSGVGKITLVDFDEICITNFNRQVHALQGNVGSSKSEIMAARMRQINPQAEIIALSSFFNFETAEALLNPRPDYIIDAIDHITSKCFLLNYCKESKIPIICATGSGGRLDPSQIRIADLAFTQGDPLARQIRRILREKYGFPKDEKLPFGIEAVYSPEQYSAPFDLNYDNGKGFRCVCPQKDNEFFNCDSRNLILGSASFVTGTFGLFCASLVVRRLIEKNKNSSVSES